jgi:hypothetical protein
MSDYWPMATRYIVVRGEGLGKLDGRWYRREDASVEGGPPPSDMLWSATAYPTDRTETNESGDIAQVYEVRGQ